MDRTVIAPWKAEEKELSEKLYQKFQGLMLLHPGTDDFRKICTDDMFLKPNQGAFFQVMHYLFRLLDVAEFKKRFYWPITDKKSEANFRSSTVEYLKCISEKHQLNWNIHMYLVVMPGGMKFITFLMEFVAFVVQELTRKREKELAPYIEVGQALDFNLKRMHRQNAFYKQYTSAYLTEADQVIAKLQTKTQMLNTAFAEIAAKTGISRHTLLDDDDFVKNFATENEQLFQKKFTERCAEVATLDEPLDELKRTIEGFQSKDAETKVDSAEVRQALRLVAEQFNVPELDNDLFAIPSSVDTIQMDSLLLAFNGVCKFLEDSYEAVEQTPRASEFLKGELDALKTELLLIESQITDFKKMLNTNKKKRETERSQQQFHTPMRGGVNESALVGVELPHKDRQRENSLRMKFVSTPPIKWDTMEQSNRPGNTRLPLLDDYSGNTTFNSFLAPPRSARKTKLSNTTLDTTLQKSKIIDSTQLLRTIKKDKSKLKTTAGALNLSGLGAKWKERQNMFATEKHSETVNPATPAKSPLSVNDHSGTTTFDRSLMATPTTSHTAHTLSPFNTNEKTRIARSQYNLYAGAANVSETSLVVLGKKLSAVKKVQDASLHLHNLSTSPSGRLDPLVTPDPSDIPKLQVNDTTLNTSIGMPLDEGDSQRNFMFNMSFLSDEDDLSSVSDSVLKDLIM